METDKSRFIFRADRANVEHRTVLQRNLCGVLRRVRTNCRFWNFGGIGLRPVKNYSRIQRKQSFGRGKQRVYINFANPMLLENELAETDQQAFERFDIYPFWPRTPLSAL